MLHRLDRTRLLLQAGETSSLQGLGATKKQLGQKARFPLPSQHLLRSHPLCCCPSSARSSHRGNGDCAGSLHWLSTAQQTSGCGVSSIPHTARTPQTPAHGVTSIVPTPRTPQTPARGVTSIIPTPRTPQTSGCGVTSIPPTPRTPQIPAHGITSILHTPRTPQTPGCSIPTPCHV